MVLLSQNGILRFTCMHNVRHYCFFSAFIIFLKNLLKPFTHSNRFFQYIVFNQQQGTTNGLLFGYYSQNDFMFINIFLVLFALLCDFFISALFAVHRFPIKYLEKSPLEVVFSGNARCTPEVELRMSLTRDVFVENRSRCAICSKIAALPSGFYTYPNGSWAAVRWATSGWRLKWRWTRCCPKTRCCKTGARLWYTTWPARR